MKQKSDLPKISIVIPSFNSEKYFPETLDSILSQNYPNLELIIQDGASTDKTVEIIKRYAKKYPKVIQWESKKDDGQCDAINIGFSKVTGEVVAYLNTDDIYTPGTLLKVGQAFKDNLDALWLTGYCPIINEKGEEFSDFVTKYKNFLINLNKRVSLLTVNYISQPSTFFKKEAFEKFGPFIGRKRYMLEYDLWLKLSKVQMPIVIPENLAKFRLVSGTLSATAFEDILSDDYKLAKEHTNNPLILLFHNLHNQARIFLVSLINHQYKNVFNTLLWGLVATFLALYLLQNSLIVFRDVYRNTRFIAQNLNADYDSKMRVYWWQIYDYLAFVRENTPENATIVVPPQERPWLSSGNAGLVKYFLYPRKVIGGSLNSLPNEKFDYVVIHKGEWADAPIDKYNWPKIKIPASEISYFDPETKQTRLVKKNFDPADPENKDAYGLIKL